MEFAINHTRSHRLDLSRSNVRTAGPHSLGSENKGLKGPWVKADVSCQISLSQLGSKHLDPPGAAGEATGQGCDTKSLSRL